MKKTATMNTDHESRCCSTWELEALVADSTSELQRSHVTAQAPRSTLITHVANNRCNNLLVFHIGVPDLSYGFAFVDMPAPSVDRLRDFSRKRLGMLLDV